MKTQRTSRRPGYNLDGQALTGKHSQIKRQCPQCGKQAGIQTVEQLAGASNKLSKRVRRTRCTACNFVTFSEVDVIPFRALLAPLKARTGTRAPKSALLSNADKRRRRRKQERERSAKQEMLAKQQLAEQSTHVEQARVHVATLPA